MNCSYFLQTEGNYVEGMIIIMSKRSVKFITKVFYENKVLSYSTKQSFIDAHKDVFGR